MAFVANYNGERVVSLNFSTDDWLSLKANYREHALFCNDPDCRSPMIPKTYSSTGTQFFAHKSRNVSCVYSGGESREHLYLKEVIFRTARELGFLPDFEVFLKIRRADVLVCDDIVFEVQLSLQSLQEYMQRSQDYWDLGKKVYWVVREAESSEHARLPYPAVFLYSVPDDLYFSGNSIPTIAIYEAFKSEPAFMPLDEWVRDVLQHKSLWISDCVAFEDRSHWHCVDGACDRKAARREERVLKRRAERKKARKKERKNRLLWETELRKLFHQWWGFIIKATDKYPLGEPPQEAFHLQIKSRYGTTFDALKSDDLRDIFNTIGVFPAEGILKWLYPEHICYKSYRMSPQSRRARKYARDLCHSQQVKTAPNCSCDSKHHTVGAFNTFKQKNGAFQAYLFCNRCGAKSSKMISKRKLTQIELKSVCEWVRGIVNYTKTDFKPWD